MVKIKLYSINEVSALTDIPSSKLRYYEKEGLLPLIQRDKNGIRLYNETDLDWIQFIRALRSTDMSIANIKRYVRLFREGNDTVQERKELIQDHKKNVELEIAEKQKHLKRLERKIKYYDAIERRIERMKF
ncbi:MerR family transcriptional regulator [Paenibacillus sp. L3-i20]|uniref:MerR family transcriptional regulator n=1 Tax=Paenibacillus sp. L3-i20 TaxID=2905833 RepID=UPI001EDCA021|nr:MerR family transcriptional regulator [Paenibacillus sp. L3-i20]GKU79115.1 MerR family transcriptional regulator [Paenibacillus sp. L3-i20]